MKRKRTISWAMLTSGTDYAQREWERLGPLDLLVAAVERLITIARRRKRHERDAG